MTLCAVIAFVERFQTLAVGLVGFAGVMLTLWYNARLARRQRRDELAHERATLRAALTVELEINRESMRGNLARLQAGPPVDTVVPTDLMEDAYRTFIQKIGILSQAEVHSVMSAYLRLRTYNAHLFCIGVLEKSDRFVRVHAGRIAELAAAITGGLGPVEEAIDALERARDAE